MLNGLRGRKSNAVGILARLARPPETPLVVTSMRSLMSRKSDVS